MHTAAAKNWWHRIRKYRCVPSANVRACKTDAGVQQNKAKHSGAGQESGRKSNRVFDVHHQLEMTHSAQMVHRSRPRHTNNRWLPCSCVLIDPINTKPVY